MSLGRFADMPARVARLPVDHRGFPVPWFVAWRDGAPQFPVIDAGKLALAWTAERCWVCGEALGAWRGWIVGPLSALEGATPEPPSHCDCAGFAVTACPHLASADARFAENADAAPGHVAQANVSRLRTDATGIWVTRGRGATAMRAGGGVLFRLEPPQRLEWWARRRPATGQDVRAALDAALPVLRRTAEAEGRAAALEARMRWLQRWTPADEVAATPAPG
ncbi:hypothetical protein ACO2Q3_12100 [Caulobacter sp. KR2-114]|uniref:hypothetical protein n=1 Tax=Caulobacter sp. KR2-114 TaxID=3400912 RepID=UPI003C02D4DC